MFIDVSSSITIKSPTIVSLCVEESSFIDCFRDEDYHGGAITVDCYSNCVLNKICAYQCFTSLSVHLYGQFCFIRVQAGSFDKNIAHQLSVCKCSPLDNGHRYISMDFYNGNISLNNVNSSHNRCYGYSGIELVRPSINYVTHSTFSNNTDTTCICLGFYENSHNMNQCNIIRNHQNQIDQGLIYNGGSAQTTLSGCIIDMNTGFNYLICIASGGMNLFNCYTQSNAPNIGVPNIQSSLSDSMSLLLNHFYSGMCLPLIDNNVPWITNAIRIFNVQISKAFPYIIILYSITLS